MASFPPLVRLARRSAVCRSHGLFCPLQSSFEFHANLFAGDHLGDRTAL
ncbi:MAG: hypothetical protein E6243_09895 [Cutibacterium avidum]|nr:hypothetical protein [Cutibacterium avidum]MDK7699598.1 hypothetical protein [Cutibacterium avidum]MDU2370653.1 hypothetical protein [Cutibacterium avidum]MDU5074967.1 hypothetical protein [Cutibacterium avidum]